MQSNLGGTDALVKLAPEASSTFAPLSVSGAKNSFGFACFEEPGATLPTYREVVLKHKSAL